MNTLLLQKISLCAALAITLQTAHAKTHTNYIGPDNGLYSDPANWSNGVPINNTFDAINNTDFIIRLDIDPTIKSLTLGADFGRLFGTDHNFTVTGNTDMGAFNRIDVVAQSLFNVKFDLGNLKNFSGKTLNSGGYFVTAAPGTTSKLQFNRANIVTNNASIGIIGAGAAIVGALLASPAVAAHNFQAPIQAREHRHQRRPHRPHRRGRQHRGREWGECAGESHHQWSRWIHSHRERGELHHRE